MARSSIGLSLHLFSSGRDEVERNEEWVWGFILSSLLARLKGS